MSDLGNKEIFGRNLTYYVEHSGRDQREIAEVIGVAPSTFNEWVKGRKYPRIDKIEALAQYFGILKSDLIEDPNGEDPTPSEPQLTGVDKELWDELMPMSKEQKQFVLAAIRGFSKNLSKD